MYSCTSPPVYEVYTNSLPGIAYLHLFCPRAPECTYRKTIPDTCLESSRIKKCDGFSVFFRQFEMWCALVRPSMGATCGNTTTITVPSISPRIDRSWRRTRCVLPGISYHHLSPINSTYQYPSTTPCPRWKKAGLRPFSIVISGNRKKEKEKGFGSSLFCVWKMQYWTIEMQFVRTRYCCTYVFVPITSAEFSHKDLKNLKNT